MLSPHLLNVSPEPFTSGGFGDVYEGTLDGSRVCVKRIRVYTQDGPQKAARVRYQHLLFPRLPSLMKPTDLLSRGYNVETLDAPKHPTPTRCHYHTLPTYFKLDVRRGSAEIY